MRIAIIGLGWVARDYMLPAIAAHPEVELCAAVSVREADFAGLPASVGRFTDADDMLSTARPDAVYVATPNHLHAAHVMACARAKVDVLCEKPLAATITDAERLVHTAMCHGIAFATAYDQRHHPAHRIVRDWAQTGKLGTITQARIDYACWLPADWCTDNWRIDQAKAGGGAIIDLAPHGLDLLEFILGDTIQQLHIFQQHAVQDYSVDDGGVLSVKFHRQTLASLTVGYNRPETLPRRRLEITGTKGLLLAENTMGQTPGGTLHFIDASTGQREALPFDTDTSPFHQQLDAFVRYRQQRQGRHPLDDLRLARLLDDALRRSAVAASESVGSSPAA